VLIQSIVYTFAPEDADKAETMLRELRDLSRKEEGIVTFDVARSKEKPNVFVLWEEYKDQAAIDSHLTTEHFKRLGINGIRILAKQRVAEVAIPLT
jgi:(4S)-4-hydroxy-5-phosphonooxypentane-2,3-dione isomerase